MLSYGIVQGKILENNLELDSMLRTLDDFIQFSHKVSPCVHMQIRAERIFHEQLCSRLRRGPLALKEVHELDDDQYAVLMLLLFSYRKFFSQNLHVLKPLFTGTSDEELGAPLTLAMSMGCPINITKNH